MAWDVVRGPCGGRMSLVQVLVIGATRGTGQLLVEQLLRLGHDVRVMHRDPGQGRALEAVGATPVLGDLEDELGDAFHDVDAVAFCAGSGSRTGADATLRVDLHGAVRSIDACVAAGVRRFVMLSSIAAGDPLQGPPAIRHYLAAKHAADRILLASGLDATVVRPGGLTHGEPTGGVEVGVPVLGHRGDIPRADVAALMTACLEDERSIGAIFEVISGNTPIVDAVAGLGPR